LHRRSPGEQARWLTPGLLGLSRYSAVRPFNPRVPGSIPGRPTRLDLDFLTHAASDLPPNRGICSQICSQGRASLIPPDVPHDLPTAPSFSLDVRLALPAAAVWLATAAGLGHPAHITLTVAIVLAIIAAGLLRARGRLPDPRVTFFGVATLSAD